MRLRCMCRTLSISGPKMSAASAYVRSWRCNHARNVSLVVDVLISFLGSSNGGGHINSISIRRTMRVERCWVGETVLPLGESPWASDPSDSVQEGSSPTHALDSHTKPQLSPTPIGVLPGLQGGKLGLRHNLDMPVPSSRNRAEWRVVSDGARTKPRGTGGIAAT